MKSYFAATVEAAVALARQELGTDAMLVTSRKAPLEARHLGEYEVVFATVPEETTSDARVTRGSNDSPAWHSLSGEVSQLRKQVEQIASGFGRAVSLATTIASSPEMSQAMAAMLEAGIEAGVAHQVLEGARLRQAPPVGLELRAALAAEMESMLSIEARVGHPEQGPHIVALTGPPGAGKTTTLVKLAIVEGLRARRRTHLLSMDVERIGAIEQLRSYAAILGAGFDVVESPSTLGAALANLNGRDLILIDTPGYGPRDFDAATAVASAITARPEIETHLVLPAYMRPVDLVRICERYEIFGTRKLLFTRLDEVETTGAIFNSAVRTGKPVSFLCAGQQVPEDIQPATVRRILEITLPPALALEAAGDQRPLRRNRGAAA